MIKGQFSTFVRMIIVSTCLKCLMMEVLKGTHNIHAEKEIKNTSKYPLFTLFFVHINLDMHIIRASGGASSLEHIQQLKNLDST